MSPPLLSSHHVAKIDMAGGGGDWFRKAWRLSSRRGEGRETCWRGWVGDRGRAGCGTVAKLAGGWTVMSHSGQADAALPYEDPSLGACKDRMRAYYHLYDP